MSEKENKSQDQPYVYQWSYEAQSVHDREAQKRTKKRGGAVYALVMVAAFALCLALLVGTILINRLETPNDALTVAEVSDLVNPGTVLIYASSDVGSSYGTGFFVRTDGCIVTNCHIVKDAKKITVTLYTGEELEAETLWFSSVDDLAVIKVNGSGFPVLKIGNSDEVKVGDTAIAIGNPAGNLYPWTTTQGIISAVDREVTVEGLRSIADLTMLQTDAQVNPGNSGGPLCNDRGEVIGIVARKKTDYEGLGLAIPINGAMELVNAYLNTGSSSGVISSISKVRPTIGIQAAAVKMGDPITDVFSAPCDCILVVSVTEGGSADGVLQMGDLILSANGRQVTDMNDLKAILYACRMGDTLRLQVNRFGTVMDLTVKFGSAAG